MKDIKKQNLVFFEYTFTQFFQGSPEDHSLAKNKERGNTIVFRIFLFVEEKVIFNRSVQAPLVATFLSWLSA